MTVITPFKCLCVNNNNLPPILTVSEMWRIIGTIFAVNMGVTLFSALVLGESVGLSSVGLLRNLASRN